MPINVAPVTGERQGLLAFLEQQRQAVRTACTGLTDDQARATPSASPLSVGGLVRHLASVERDWTGRIEHPTTDPPDDVEALMRAYFDGFRLGEADSLAGVLEEYADAAATTDSLVLGIDDLGRAVPLPQAPWLPDPDGCTVRWVLLHLIEETARHAGHADVIRESVDAATSGALMAAAEGWPEDGWITPWRPAGTVST